MRSISLLSLAALILLAGSAGTGTAVAADWTVPTLRGVTRAVGDVGWGPELEVVTGGLGIEIFDAEGVSIYEWDWPGGLGLAAISLGEVWPSLPGLEIVVRSSQRIYVIHAPTGTVSLAAEAVPAGMDWTNHLVLADVDGDRDDEILFADSTGLTTGPFNLLTEFALAHVLHPLTTGGSVHETVEFPPQPDELWDLSRLYAGDVEFDGIAEIGTKDAAAGQFIVRPFHLVRLDGSPMPGFPAVSSWGTQHFGAVAFADLDHSGSPEIIGSQWQTLFAIEADASLYFPGSFVAQSFTRPPVIGNFDGDPNLEIALGSHWEFLRVFDPDTQQVLWEYSGPYSEFFSPTAGDLNGDGVDEIVVRSKFFNGSGAYHVHAFDLVAGTELPGFPYAMPYPAGGWGDTDAHVDLYDLDRDGDLELIFESRFPPGSIIVLDVDNPGTPVFEASWPTFEGNAARNNDYHYRRGPYPAFVRGDANDDGQVNLGDALTQLMYMFFGAPTNCLEALDTDANDTVDLADAVSLLQYLFLTGAGPEAPFPDCAEILRTPRCSVSRVCP